MKVFRVEYDHLLGPQYFKTGRSEETALRAAKRACGNPAITVRVFLEPNMKTKEEAFAASLALINQPVLLKDGTRALKAFS